MAEYRWNNGSIKEVVTVHDQKFPTAWIVASHTADTSLYAKLPDLLQHHGLQMMADIYDGKPALRVRGFKDDNRLLELLNEAGAVSEPPQETLHADSTEKQDIKGLQGWVKENSMVAAGISYLAADALAFMSGFARDDKAGMSQGVMWGLTSVMLALYGTRNPKRQMDNLYFEMEKHLKEQGVELDEQDMHTLTMLKGNAESFYDRMVNFIYQHPVELNNSIQGLGGMMLFKAGLNQKTRNWNKNPLIPSKSPNYFKAAAGLCVAGGMWGGMLIPENEEAGLSEAEKEQRFLDRLEGKELEEPRAINIWENPVAWVKQKPLRLSGYGAMINNFLVFASSWGMEPRQVSTYLTKVKPKLQKEFQKERATIFQSGSQEQIRDFMSREKAFDVLDKDQMQRQIGLKYDKWTPGPNIVANYLYAASPKDRRGSLKEDGYLDELYTMAANVFGAMPDEVADKKIVQFSGFIANRDEMKSTADEVEEAIRTKIAQLKDNPWQHVDQKQEKETPDPKAEHIAHVQKGINGQESALQPSA